MYMKLNNKIKLLALDVDGTLFDNAGQIPEKNILRQSLKLRHLH